MWRREENKRGSVRKIERVSGKDCRRDVQDEVRKTEERYRTLEIWKRERKVKKREARQWLRRRGREMEGEGSKVRDRWIRRGK